LYCSIDADELPNKAKWAGIKSLLRYRHEVGTCNLSTVRKVISSLSKDENHKCGRAGKRILAASDPIFRERVLKNLFCIVRHSAIVGE